MFSHAVKTASEQSHGTLKQHGNKNKGMSSPSKKKATMGCFPCTAAVPLPVSSHNSKALPITKIEAVNGSTD